MKIDNFVKIMICFVIFSWIFRTCEFHFSRVSICTLKTRMLIFDWIVFESILIVIVMSNFFEFLMKWIICIWSKRTRTYVKSLIALKACAFFRSFRRCFFHKSICWHHRRIREILCSFEVCCTFLINRHCKTNIKSKKRKTLRNFNLHREWFDHFLIHCESRETIEQKIANSVDDLARKILFFMLCINLTCDIMSKTLVMFKLNKMINRFVFVFIRCEFVRWKISKSFQLIDFFDISWTCRSIINAFSLFTRSSCSWWTQEIFRWCLITRSIDTFSKSFNLSCLSSSMWWCWFF
jgi:hypothetical protein